MTSQKDVWDANIRDELAFWEWWLTDDKFIEHRQARMNSARPIGRLASRLQPDQAVYTLLDVGSGPVSTVGCLAPGKIVQLFAVDPLAADYNEMLNRLGNHNTVRPIKVDGERLTETFPLNYFDACHSANALDHCYDPILVLQQMILVCKPGGWINLNHWVNEGEHEGYTSLHQWNLDAPDGRFVVWNKTTRHDVATCVPDIGLLEVEIAQAGDRKGLHVWMQKLQLQTRTSD